MVFELSIFNGALIQKQAVNEIMKCNDLTVKFGLILTEEQAIELVETRSYALKQNGRIEFGGGVIDKIIRQKDMMRQMAEIIDITDNFME
ncbi:DUF6323 family protein [Ruminiclostridium herbifermentans]|uniref:DUF6323 family protein n=1 Tax=Ruminiclostridium herbifermentans TaxID=2488810 RepID=UPI0026D66FD0